MARLLERERELQFLSEALAEAAGGRGSLVLIGGEAGVGKSSLVDTFAESAAGATVLTGSCDPLPTPPALGPLLDIAPRLGAPFAQLLDGSRSGALLFPAILAQLELRTTATVLVFEDVHWADQATIDLVGYLGRRMRRLRVVFVVTYRSTEVSNALTVVLGHLAGVAGVARLELGALSPAATAELVAAAATPADPDAMYRLTGGNPFFITEILRDGDAGVIPHTIRDALLARLARLSPDARAAVFAAAAIGVNVETGLFATVLETIGTPRWAIQEAISGGVLEHDGGLVRFRHELARAAIAATTPGRQSQALHRSILEVLRRGPLAADDYADLVRHAEAAGDDTAVVQLAPVAAERAASLGAHRQAAELYSRVVERAQGMPKVRAEALEGRGGEQYAQRHFEEALADHLEAARLCHALEDIAGEARNLIRAAYLGLAGGERTASEALLRTATELVAELPPCRELAMVYEAWSRRAFVSNDPPAAEMWASRAISAADLLGDAALSLEAAITAAIARLQRGDPAAHAALVALRQQAHARSHAQLWAIDTFMRVTFYLVLVPTLQRNYAAVDQFLQQGLDYASEHDLAYWRSMFCGVGVLRAMDGGQWHEAMQLAQAILHAESAWRARIMALTCSARVFARRGDPAAHGYLEQAIEAAEGDPAMIDLLRVAQAEVAFLAGQRTLDSESPSPTDAWMYGEWALWTALTTGKPPELRATPAEPFQAELAGNWHAAATFWEQAGCPYELGVALAQSAEPGAVRRAIDIFDRLSAVPAQAYARRRLRELGVSVIPRGRRASTSANPAGLTSREQEVLILVARGSTNAEIAASLFLSEKTVERHLSGAFSKLEATSRVEAVNAARRLHALDLTQS